MRSWYDLSKEERKELEKEFIQKTKNQYMVTNFILAILGGASGVLILMYLFEVEEIDSIWMIVSVIIIFIIIIYCVTTENNAQKEFSTWLEVSKNIKK